MKWQTGVPPVAPGESKDYWVAYNRPGDSKTFYKMLSYLNKYVMPLHDACPEVEEKYATPIPDSDGDYWWTGWFEPYCEQCEVHWISHLKVLAWMELPRDFDDALSLYGSSTPPVRWCLQWTPTEKGYRLHAFVLGMPMAGSSCSPYPIFIDPTPTDHGTFWTLYDHATGEVLNAPTYSTLEQAKQEAEIRMRSRL